MHTTARILAGAIAFQATLVTLISHGQTGGGAPIAPGVKINEICPDPAGSDLLGHEYIELTNTSTNAVDLSGIKIRNEDASVLYTLPSITIPGRNASSDQNYYLVIYMGYPESWRVDDDFLDGDFRRITYASHPDSISNNKGAIYLAKSGTIHDALICGDSEPSGAGVTTIKSKLAWSLARVKTNLNGGGVPIANGGILGRDLNSKDTNKRQDFRVDGGPSSVGATIGRRNNSISPSVGQLHEWAQGQINSILALYSLSNNGFINITGASHSNQSILDPDLFAGYEVTSQYTIDIDNVPLGQPEQLTGSASIEYERVVGSSFSLALDADLASASFDLNLSITQTISGFGTSQNDVSSHYSATFTDDQGGFLYLHERRNLRSRLDGTERALHHRSS